MTPHWKRAYRGHWCANQNLGLPKEKQCRFDWRQRAIRRGDRFWLTEHRVSAWGGHARLCEWCCIRAGLDP